MDKITKQEILVLKKRLNFAEKKLSDFADTLHHESTESIDTTDGGLEEIAELVAELLERVEALEGGV